MDSAKLIFLSAVVLTGILCGASLDQSIKQLPARHRIGMAVFSSYAKAADLKNGVTWYAILGIGSTLSSVTAAILLRNELSITCPIYLAAFFAVCHAACTTIAAPTYFRQKKLHDEDSLRILFKKFELISAIRSVFITINFLCLIWCLAIIL